MDQINEFYRDKGTCSLPPTHIMGKAEASPLKEIDELYGAADVLSIQNALKHRRVLLALSVAGTLLTLAFLLYDEAELHGLIIGCGVMILCLFFIRHLADRQSCHRKYLEYRVLAECLRCQFFLSFAGIRTRVSDLLPWSIREAIPWIGDILKTLPEDGSPEPMKKHSVLDCWVMDQKDYHKTALERALKKSRRDSRIARAALVVTIIVYIAALFYELVVYRSAAGTGNADLIRAILKIVLGTMSALTLFTGSYYGKMSLPNEIDDHKRMIALYETAQEEMTKNGESEELLVFLAREFLNENSTWYAYQSKNSPDIAM